MLCQLSLSSTASHRLDAMSDESAGVEAAEVVEVALEVGLGRLALVADSIGHILEVVATGARLKEMSASLVD